MAPKQNQRGPVAAPSAFVSGPQSNGMVPGSGFPPATVGAVNKKKAKRRAKEAARRTGETEPVPAQREYFSDPVDPPHLNGRLPHRDGDTPLAYDPNYYYGDSADGGLEQPEDYAYSDDDDQYSYDAATQEYIQEATEAAKAEVRRRVRNGPRSVPGSHTHPPPGATSQYPGPRPISDDALRTVQRGINSGTWNMSNAEERRQIKEYWLSLRENERKALVKIEKNDVLQKMKDQQKHSCSCTVCGRKRVAIEEELEILYDAYYKELEQYANHNQHLLENGSTMMPPPIRPMSRDRQVSRSPPRSSRPTRPRIEELPEQEEDLEEEEGDLDEDEYSDEEYDDEYSGDEEEDMNPAATEFFTFGNSLTVKGGILTVADDLLKNDGQKFIDMMEQLAERRMQREEQALNAPLPTHAPLPPQHLHNDHGHPPPEDEEYDDEEDEDYDSQDEDYDVEDDVDTMTESQRMEEGRRMFQIFAARMFEQRVLDAYRKKRSEDRANLLIQELEAEAQLQSQSGEKSAKKNEKKRLKEKAKKQALKEEKQRKDEERAAAIAEEERQKLDEQRRRQEDNRKKQEAKAEEKRRKAESARKTMEEDRAKKRAEELDRKTKDMKLKEEKRLREEAERQEKELQEKKILQEREARLKAEKLEKAKAEQDAAAKRQPEPTRVVEAPRRAPVPAVALPPTLKTRSSTGLDSPQVGTATPVQPKVAAPARPRDIPTPQTPETVLQRKRPTPPSGLSTQPTPQQSTLSRSRTPLQHTTFTPQMSPMHHIPPPPGMSSPMGPHMGMSHMSPGFPGMPNPMLHRSAIGPQIPSFSSHGAHVGPQPRSFIPQNVNGSPSIVNNNRHFMSDTMPMSANSVKQQAGQSWTPPHVRQPSIGLPTPLGPALEPSASITTSQASQPISRPAPIGRPSAIMNDVSFGRTRNTGADVDELGARLGSSALLADDDEPLPTPATDNRRVSAPFGMPSLNTHISQGTSYDHLQSPFGQSLPNDGWRSSASAFGPPGLPNAPGWGQPPSAGWGNPAPFPAMTNRHGSVPRPVSVRLLAVQAYRNLNAQSPGIEGGYFEFNDFVRQAGDTARMNHETIPNQNELRTILDTEGDMQNGGGFFATKDDKLSRRLLVKWQADPSDRMRPGMGLAIGSPLPGHSLPAIGSLNSRAF